MNSVDFIKDFYEIRKLKDPELLRPKIAQNVVWREPSVGDHMGELVGVDNVIDMISRAMETTGGSFSLAVAETIEVAEHCAAVIEWSAEKGEKTINGKEMAIFSVVDEQIVFAQFLPSNIDNDNDFWA